MTVAESGLDESPYRVGTGLAISGETPAHHSETALTKESDSPLGRRLVRLFSLAALLGALALAFEAAPASAVTGYFNLGHFGSDGTEASEFGDPDDLAIQSAEQRLYLIDKSGNSVPGFDISTALPYTPLGGNFPISAGNSSGDPGLGVDNTAGATAGNIYYQGEFTGQLEGFDSTGAGLGGVFPISHSGGDTCGVDVDSSGTIWGSAFGPNVIRGFSPTTGNIVAEIDVSEQGNPCDIAFDLSNDDIYVETWHSKVWKWTAASGYTSGAPFDDTAEQNRGVDVNSATGEVFVAHANTVTVYSSAGEELATFDPTNNIEDVGVNDANGFAYATVTAACCDWVEVFGLLNLPKVTTGPPVGNTEVSGVVDEDGAGEVTECYFEFGETTAYGETEECTPSAPFSGVQEVTANLPGLLGESTYHYRLVAANAEGTNRGADETITPHYVQNLQTEAATSVQRTTATLNASFDGHGVETFYYFEWGPTAAYGSQSAVPPGESAGITVGHTPLSFEVTGLQAGTQYHYRVVAENAEGVSPGNDETFTTLPPVLNLTTDPPTGVEATAATLNGSFDIDALGGETFYYFQIGQTTSYGTNTATPPGESAGSVPSHPTVSSTVELSPGTTYHYRIVATNDLGTAFGGDQEFTTFQPPSIAAATSANVTASTADLLAKINPNGAATTYRFEYGTTPSFGQTIPSVDKDIGSGFSPVEEVQHLENLQVGATYHFRIVAENEWGQVASDDQTFQFFIPDCPNALVRQQTGAAYLPDCRAYELVSPANAGAVQLFTGNGIGALEESTLPPGASFHSVNEGASDAFAFFAGVGQIPGTNPPNIAHDMYVSKRTSTTWVTHYPGLEASQTLWAGGTRCDQPLDRCINYDYPDPLLFNEFDVGSSSPFVFDTMQNSVSVGRFPTNVDEIAGGDEFHGDGEPSADFSHYGFSSIDVPFAPGGLTEAPGSAYDNDTAANTNAIISKMPGGEDIPPGAGGPEEFIMIPAISADGSHILMSTEAPKDTNLIMHVEPGDLSYDVGGGHGVAFVGMTRDGSQVFLTSDEQLTGEDLDESVDMYRWSAASDSLTLLSAGSLGSGNTSECPFSFVPNCNIQPVTATIDRQGNQPIFTPDNTVAENGEVYFYSPEQLDGTGNGFANQRNLYVFRNGAPRYVATLGNPAAAAVRRMQITPNGNRVAFVTSSQLTGYENEGFREMYTFQPGSGKLVCVSCVPTGDAPASDVQASQNGLFMSDDGRTFFSTDDPLVPFDTDGLRSVYEYTEGRPQLISSGTASQDTWGGGLLLYPSMTVGLEGVSADGTDVFFSSFEKLTAQDENGEFLKFYTARAGGGLPVDPPPPPCQAADECHTGASAPPPVPQVGTGARLGRTGNMLPNCGQHSRRAKRQSRRAKNLRRRARAASSGQVKRRLNSRARAISRSAKRSSNAAKRCRRNARRAR